MIMHRRATAPPAAAPFLAAITASMLASVWTVQRAQADSFSGPTFRQGMWHFERKLERLHGPAGENSLLMKREMTRCVDPTSAMKATFASPDIGNCRSAKPDLRGHQYVFSLRCDFMGPVKTTITVENNGAYTEVNELAVGPLPRVETVIARRVGDCK